MDLTALIIQAVSGAIGGNAAGAASGGVSGSQTAAVIGFIKSKMAG